MLPNFEISGRHACRSQKCCKQLPKSTPTIQIIDANAIVEGRRPGGPLQRRRRRVADDSSLHREGSGKLNRARSRQNRSQILQVNMRLKALAEIYTMHSFAQLSNLNFLLNFAKLLAKILPKFLQI